MMRSAGFVSLLRARGVAVVVAVLLLLATSEAWRQHVESMEMRSLAQRVVADAHATTRRSEVIALRDYIRAHVTFKGAPYTDDERPFLRATALETMRSGLGFCGEDSRAFIVMADAIGIPAARINLYGPSHVVALTELDDGQAVIVDAMSTPTVDDLEPLDRAMVQHGFTDYSTLNVRRLHVAWLFSRIKLTIGPLTFWGENPHAMKALFWASLAAAIVAVGALRVALRHLLRRLGWVHRSSLASLPLNAPAVTGTPSYKDA